MGLLPVLVLPAIEESKSYLKIVHLGIQNFGCLVTVNITRVVCNRKENYKLSLTYSTCTQYIHTHFGKSKTYHTCYYFYVSTIIKLVL